MRVVWLLSKTTPSTPLYSGFSGFTLNAGRLVQSSNVEPPRFVTPAPSRTLLRLVQDANTPPPKPATSLGMVTLARLEQASNAESPRLVTPLPSTTFVSPHCWNAEFAMLAKLPGKRMPVRLGQNMNAWLPMLATLLPRLTLAKPAQS